MAQETVPQTTVPTPAPRGVRQAIAGVTPPQISEARIREEWPTVLGINPAVATLSRKLVKTVLLAPLGWLLLLPIFGLKLSPFLCRRYTLTNRRLMIRRGWKPAPVQEIALADIDEVRLDPASIDSFYLAGTLEIVSRGQVVMRLPGTPEPEGFRQAIINAYTAWVPSKATGPFQAASAVPATDAAK
jgi:hypothetical protein